MGLSSAIVECEDRKSQALFSRKLRIFTSYTRSLPTNGAWKMPSLPLLVAAFAAEGFDFMMISRFW
jgi:hypothetical protein